MKIALVSYRKEEKFAQGVTNDEDTELLDFLIKKNLHVIPVIWDDEQVDWSSFQVALIKSPWDYHNNLQAFLLWLDQLQKWGIQVLNPVEIIEWNSHKRYLKDLANKGLSVIQTEYIDQGTVFDDHFFDLFQTDKLVLKPCISAGAENTITVHSANLHAQMTQIEQLLSKQDYMVQPFVAEIKNGEWSFLFFNGKYSHCSLKIPQQGDFRVQHHYGGSITYPVPDSRHVEQAATYLQSLPQSTLYARVDGVIINNSFELMELELIEPYLFFNDNEDFMENYYRALMELIPSINS